MSYASFNHTKVVSYLCCPNGKSIKSIKSLHLGWLVLRVKSFMAHAGKFDSLMPETQKISKKTINAD
jgi:hypothetical protein